MGEKNQEPESEMNIPDHISKNLETIFWVKNTLNLLWRSGSGTKTSRIRSSRIRATLHESYCHFRYATVWVWIKSSLVVRASDCQCRSRNSPGFDPSFLRHSGIWGAADEAVLNTVQRKKNPQKILLLTAEARERSGIPDPQHSMNLPVIFR